MLGSVNVPDRSGYGFMPVAEAARKLGIGRLRVIRFIKTGQLYGRLHGGRFWFARRDSVKKFLARHGRGYTGAT